MPGTMLKRKGQKTKKRMQHNVRAVGADSEVSDRYGTRKLGRSTRLASSRAMVAQGVGETNPEVAATIVSESIGKTLTMRREARAKGEDMATAKLSEKLAQLVALRDLVHSGDEEAIKSVLAGAWS